MLRTDKELSSWTGIGSFKILKAIIDSVELTLAANSIKSSMDLDKLIVMVFIKLKMNLPFVIIATLFKITDRTVAKRFYFILPYLKSAMSVLIYWPEKEEIVRNMPRCFIPFMSTRVVLDCFESQIATLKCLTCRILTYSHYKNKQTTKFCIGVTPAGLTSYLSAAYGGRASDKFIFNDDQLLKTVELIPHTDSIMVDKGFFIEKECDEYGVKLIRPPFLRKVPQLTKSDAAENVKIAKARVHVERAIQRVRLFKIMTQTVERHILPWIDDIGVIVCAMVNLSAPILSDDKF